MRLSCGIVAGALQLRTEAAAPDELLRNQWTDSIGMGGRFGPVSTAKRNAINLQPESANNLQPKMCVFSNRKCSYPPEHATLAYVVALAR